MSFKIVIPARYNSLRLKGKPLANLEGKTIIQRVYEQACTSQASHIVIATDDERIRHIVKDLGAEVCMTSPLHPSGTDRLQEVVALYGWDDNDIIVNVQGDEPFIPPVVIDQVASVLENNEQTISLSTLSCPLFDVSEIFNPSIVKVVTNKLGDALYFSRAPVPWHRESFSSTQSELPMDWIYQRHLGIYAYRASQLHAFVKWKESPLEAIERLEQLRFLWNGQTMRVASAIQTPPHGIDTEEDLKHAQEYIQQTSLAV